MSPSATTTDAAPAATAVKSQISGNQLAADNMTYTLIPEAEQGPVPGLYDPIRATQRAMTAHMVQALWRAESGWEHPKMMPYGKIALEPTASVLHYATESFEGMKVYRGYDGKLRLFRPWLNCQRLAKSNARVCLPDFDQGALLGIIAAYLGKECRRWLPEPGSNLYVRPAMIGSGSALGIQRPPEALFFLFAALFPQPSKTPSPGIKLLASDPEYIRAWPGGFGSAKVGASYGPAMVAQAKARENDCHQTLWLFGEKKLVTEAGASNFFVVWRRKDSDDLELITTSLDTEIVLDGITRRSVLEMARERLTVGSKARSSDLKPIEVVERPFSIDEIVEAEAEGRLVECFVSGTAMFVLPVSAIKYGDHVINFPMMVTEQGQKTPAAQYALTLKSWLEGVMYGREDHEWAYVIEEQ